MNVNRRWLYGGVFLIALGAVLLVAQDEAVDGDVVAQALRLWPVLVIALGIGLLLRRTRFNLAGGMLAAAMPGLLLGGLIVAAPGMGPECRGIEPASFETQQGTFDGAASINLTLACGDLSVTTAPGGGWQLETGNATGPAATVEVSAAALRVASSSLDRAFGPFRGHDAWRLALPTANTLDLAAEISAGRGRFDLAGARLGTMALVVNAGEARVDLSRATVDDLSVIVRAASVSLDLPVDQDLGADFSVDAGALRICAPSELGLRIRHDGVLGTTNYTGFVRSGDTWESPGYSMANHHADVTVTANVGSVDVNPVGGCK